MCVFVSSVYNGFLALALPRTPDGEAAGVPGAHVQDQSWPTGRQGTARLAAAEAGWLTFTSGCCIMPAQRQVGGKVIFHSADTFIQSKLGGVEEKPKPAINLREAYHVSKINHSVGISFCKSWF